MPAGVQPRPRAFSLENNSGDESPGDEENSSLLIVTVFYRPTKVDKKEIVIMKTLIKHKQYYKMKIRIKTERIILIQVVYDI